MGSLTIACLSTFAALGLLALTEAYDPPGSSLAWLITIGLIAGHLPLLSRDPDDPRYRPAAPFGPRVALVAAPILLVLAMAWPLWKAHDGIFTTAVLPRKSAQLGLMTQVVSRLGGEDLLYGYTYPRDGYTQVNPFPVGGVIPYALARQAGLDWRYANLAAGALLLALLIPGVIALARRGDATAGTDNERALAVLAMALAGGGWMALGRSTDYLNWGTAAVLWPLILCLGYCLAARLSLLAALCAGLLAAMNPGWLLLLPVVLACLYKDGPRDFPKCLLLAIVAPLLAWSAFQGEFQVMLEGILGGPFSDGAKQSHGASWRFPSIHGLADWLSARHLVYLLAVGVLGFLAREIVLRADRRERLRLLAVAGFIVVACAPATYFFHWMAHGILLAGLLPAIAAAPGTEPASSPGFTFRLTDWLPGTAAAALLAAAIFFRLHGGIDGTLDRLPGQQQGVDRNLLSGFNVRSEDHAWGKDPNMAVGFTMTKRRPGTLELHLGTIGGDFTPFNPTTIRVNGKQHGVFHALPGDYRYARVPLSREDLIVGFNVVELDAAWSRTPRSLNVANDDRHVSINFLGMRLLPPAEGAKPN